MTGIGVVGAGGIVSAAHLPAYCAAGFSVRAIFDRDRPPTEALAWEFSIPHLCGSFYELLADDSVDIVDIAVTAVSSYTAAMWVCLAFLGIVCFTLTRWCSFGFWSGLMPGRSMLFTYLRPVFDVLTAASTLGEKVTLPMAAGGTIVLAATLLAMFEKPKVKPSEVSLRTAQQ